MKKLDELPLPFITQLKSVKNSAKYFSVVNEVNDNEVRFFDPESHRWALLPKERFLDRFSGIVLLAYAGEDAGEKDYPEKVKAEKRRRISQYLMAMCMPVIVLLAGAIAFTQVGAYALLPVVFSILTLGGCTVTALLLWYEIDQHNPALKQICSAGKKVNCSAVLQSKAAKIGGISWSAIGFTYFMGLLLLFVFSGLTNPTALFTISCLTVLVLPYIAFSIYYQWRIAKQWCALCLCVQGLLVLQFITAAIGQWHSIIPLNADSSLWILQAGIAFILPFIATLVILPAMQKARESKRLINELQRLKHNPQVFDALLQKQQQVTVPPSGLGITLGNPEALYKLIKVCNPYCSPCSKAHKPMENLLNNNPDLQLQIVFTATNDEGDITTPPVKHFLAIAEENDEVILKQALDSWYLTDEKDYETFAAKYPVNSEFQAQNAKIQAMKDWCDKAEIPGTPSFFVSMPDSNNHGSQFYRLPEGYSVADLKYFFAV